MKEAYIGSPINDQVDSLYKEFIMAGTLTKPTVIMPVIEEEKAEPIKKVKQELIEEDKSVKDRKNDVSRERVEIKVE